MNDALLSTEAHVKFFKPIPSWIQYLRVVDWLEPHFPNPRALFGAVVVACTISRDTAGALRIAYLLCDESGNDGWHPVPSHQDPHGGQIIVASSFEPGRRPEPFVSSIKPGELSQWRANMAASHEYWQKWAHHHPVSSWPEVQGEPKPKGFLSRLLGK